MVAMASSKSPSTFLSALFLGAALVATAGPAGAHDGKSHDAALAAGPVHSGAHDGKSHDAAPPADSAGVSIPVDVTLYDEFLLDQDGRRVRLVSDVIADRIVVMDFIYTTCPTVCPVLSAIFQKVQAQLGDRLGRDVVMISVSVDPGTDTPARLKAYARKYKARPGWVFLTGGKRVVEKVLEGLGAYSQDFTAHPNMTMVGDGRSGQWMRSYGFADPNQIVAHVDRLIAASR
jgi:protein SCO1/2